jgi:hypothetical protein
MVSLMASEHRLKMAVNMAVRQRNYQRARQRAFTRLANAYPDIYKAFFQEEKQNDKTQGKTWIDLDGNTNTTKHSNTNEPSSTDWQNTVTREDESD